MILPLSLATLLLVTVFLFRRRRRQPVAGASIQALGLCADLIQLAGHLQQHRGMSSAWLAGDQSFARPLSAKRNEIDALFHPLHQAALEECKQALPCLTVNDLALFRFKWRELTDGLSRLSVEKSISEHSQLIATVLDWLDAIGEARIALTQGDRLPPGQVRNYVHRLPALTECLGQARAIGSSVAARGKCSAVARVRLMFLVNRAESLLDQAVAADEARHGSGAQAAVQSLAGLIRERILGGNGTVDLGADSYFGQATQTINSVYTWIAACGSDLRRDLAQH
ncbi:hypothetical protein DLREEDagrD3_04710 [Denitratisoma sp. agr-D3]